MAFPASLPFEDEDCPVPEELFKQVRDAPPPNAAEIASTLPELQRAQLAVFCYRKRHLHELGLTIASTCSCGALVQVAGTGGRTIFEQSRDPQETLEKERRNHARPGTKTVTLATRVESFD